MPKPQQLAFQLLLAASIYASLCTDEMIYFLLFFPGTGRFNNLRNSAQKRRKSGHWVLDNQDFPSKKKGRAGQRHSKAAGNIIETSTPLALYQLQLAQKVTGCRLSCTHPLLSASAASLLSTELAETEKKDPTVCAETSSEPRQWSNQEQPHSCGSSGLSAIRLAYAPPFCEQPVLLPPSPSPHWALFRLLIWMAYLPKQQQFQKLRHKKEKLDVTLNPNLNPNPM
eukprot:765359-Pelagomonas_calceolata.AAC.1